MGLREKFMVKQVYGDTDLSLEAKPGKSLLVKDLFIFDPTLNYVTLSTDLAKVGYLRVGGNLGNHLALPMGSPNHSHGMDVDAGAASTAVKKFQFNDAFGAASGSYVIGEDGAFTDETNIVTFGSSPGRAYETILALLRRLGLFNGYPVAEGQTFLVTGAKKATSLQLAIYEEYDAGDIKKTDPNGSDAKEYVFINYGRVAAAISTTVETIFGTLQTAAEFPDFPYGKDVPANTAIDLLGILASDIVDDRGSDDDMCSEYLKLVRGRETLFDADKNGLLLKGITGVTDAVAQIARGLSIIGNFSDVDHKLPMLFDPPLTFAAGEELGIYLSTTAGSSQSASDLAAADTEIGLIERVRLAG